MTHGCITVVLLSTSRHCTQSQSEAVLGMGVIVLQPFEIGVIKLVQIKVTCAAVISHGGGV